MRSWARVWSGLPAILLLIGLQVGAVSGAAAQSGRAWLGVVTQDLDQDLRDGMDYRGDGILINEISSGSPADRAGLETGDVLISVNGRSINSPRELSDVIGNMRVGQSATLVVVRDGERRTLNARLGARPQSMLDDSRPSDRARRMRDRELREKRDSKAYDRLDKLDKLDELDKLDKLDELGKEFDLKAEPFSGDNLILRGMGRGRLGVRVENLNSDLAPYFESEEGALIVEVMKDTPAEKAGLKAGDVITQIGDENISSADDVVKAIQSAPEGRVPVTISRRGSTQTVDCELDAAPRAWRLRDGDGTRGFMFRNGPRERRSIPTPPGADRDEELRELRQQLKELQEKIDRLERP